MWVIERAKAGGSHRASQATQKDANKAKHVLALIYKHVLASIYKHALALIYWIARAVIGVFASKLFRTRFRFRYIIYLASSAEALGS